MSDRKDLIDKYLRNIKPFGIDDKLNTFTLKIALEIVPEIYKPFGMANIMVQNVNTGDPANLIYKGKGTRALDRNIFKWIKQNTLLAWGGIEDDFKVEVVDNRPSEMVAFPFGKDFFLHSLKASIILPNIKVDPDNETGLLNKYALEIAVAPNLHAFTAWKSQLITDVRTLALTTFDEESLKREDYYHIGLTSAVHPTFGANIMMVCQEDSGISIDRFMESSIKFFNEKWDKNPNVVGCVPYLAVIRKMDPDPRIIPDIETKMCGSMPFLYYMTDIFSFEDEFKLPRIKFNIEDRIQELVRKLRDCDARHDSNTEKDKEMSQLRLELKACADQFNQEIPAIRAENERQKQLLAQNESEKQILESKLTKSQSELQQSASEIAETVERERKCKEDLSTKQEMVRQNQKEVEKREKLLTQIGNEKQRLESELTRYQQSASEAAEREKKCSEDLSQRQERMKRMGQINADAQSAIELMENQLSEKNSVIQTTSAKNLALETDLATLKKQRGQEASDQLTSALKDLTTCKDENTALSKSSITVQEELKTCRLELALQKDAKEKETKCREELVNTEKEKEACTRKMVDIEKELQALKQTIAAQVETIRLSADESKKQTNELAASKSENAKLIMQQTATVKQQQEDTKRFATMQQDRDLKFSLLNINDKTTSDDLRGMRDKIDAHDGMDKNVKKLESELTTLKQAMQNAAKKVGGQSEAAIDQLKKDVENKNREIATQKQSLVDQTALIERQKNEASTREQALKTSQLMVGQLEQQKKDYEANLKLLNIKPNVDKSELGTIKSKLDAYDGVQQNNQKLAQELVVAEQTVKQVKAEVEKTVKQNAELDKQIVTLKSENKQFESVKEEFNLCVAARQDFKDRYEQVNKTLESEKRDGMKKLDELIKTADHVSKERNNAISKLTEYKKTKDAEVEDFKKKLQLQTDGEIKRAKDAIALGDGQSKIKYEAEIKTLRDANDKATKEAATEDARLKKELTDKVGEIKTLNASIETLRSEGSEKDKRIGLIEAKAAEAETHVQAFKNAEKELQKLGKELETLKTTGASCQDSMRIEYETKAVTLKADMSQAHASELSRMRQEESQKLQTMRDAYDRLTQEHAKLQQTYIDDTAKCNASIQGHIEKEKDFKRIENDHALLVAAKTKVDVELLEANQKLKEAKVALAVCNASDNKALKEKDQCLEDNARLRENLAALTGEKDVMGRQMEVEKAKFAECQKDQVEELLDLRKKAKDHDGAIQKSEEMLRTSTAENEAIKKEIEQFRASDQRKVQELAAAKLENAKIAREVEESTRINKGLHDDVQVQTIALKALQDRIAEGDAREAKGVEEITRINTDIGKYQNAILKMEADRDALAAQGQAAVKTSADEKNVITAEKTRIETELDAANVELTTLRRELVVANEKIADLIHQIAELKFELSQFVGGARVASAPPIPLSPTHSTVSASPSVMLRMVDAPLGTTLKTSQDKIEAMALGTACGQPGPKKPEGCLDVPSTNVPCELPDQVIRATCNYSTIPVPLDLKNVSLTYSVLDPGSKVRMQLLEAKRLYNVGKNLLLSSSGVVLDRSLTPLRRCYKITMLKGVNMGGMLQCSNAQYSRLLDAPSGRACRQVFDTLYGTSNTSPDAVKLATIGLDLLEYPADPENVKYKVVSGPFGKMYNQQNNDTVRPEQLYVHRQFYIGSGTSYVSTLDGKYYQSGNVENTGSLVQGRSLMVSAINHLMNAALTYMYETVYDGSTVKIAGSNRVPTGTFSMLPRCDINALLSAIILFPRSATSTNVPALTDHISTFEKDDTSTIGSSICAAGVEILENYGRETLLSSNEPLFEAKVDISNVNDVMAEAAMRVAEITRLAESLSHT